MFNKDALKKYLKNTSWLLVERVFCFSIQFIVLFYLSRHLGPGQYGTLSFVLSVVSIFTVFSSFGLERVVVKALVERQGGQGEIFGTAVFLRLLAASLAMLIIFTVTYFIPDENNERAYILIVSIGLLFQSLFVIDSYFQAETLAKYGALSRGAMALVSGAAKLLGIYLEAGLGWFVVVAFLDSVVLAAFYFQFYRRFQSIRVWKVNYALASRLFFECWPIIIMGVMTAVAIKTDQIMLNYLLGTEAVGLYAAAVRMTEIWYFIPSAIVSSLFVAVVRAREQDEEAFVVRIQRLYDLVFFIAIGISIVVWLNSGWIISLIFGDAFYQSVALLKIYIWLVVFIFMGMIRHMWILAKNLQRYELVLESSIAVFNIALNWILIPRLGVEGAAISTLTAFFIAYCIVPFLFKELRPVSRMFGIAVLHFLQLRVLRDKWLVPRY